MIKRVYFLLGMITAFAQLNAQEDHESYNSFLLRGKASTFVIIEDIYFQNWNLGGEYRFAQHHSVGIDYVHFRWRHEEDIYIDGMETGSGPDTYSRRRYILLDYRYYPFSHLMQKHRIDPYLNPFIKMGRRKIWTNDPNTLYWDNDISAIRNQRADYTDYGFALGLRFDFGENDRVGLDANIGAIYRETKIHYEEQYDYNNDIFIERFSGKHYDWKPHMRLNIYVRLF
jgi:hypothetical protein